MPEAGGLYYALPYGLKKLAASFRGRQLERERFGPETDGFIEEAHAMERWEPDAIQRWQDDRLQEMLRHTACQVSAYRQLFNTSDGVDRDVSRLDSWPILHKAALRGDLGDFVADDVRIRDCSLVSTSGSTGTPLQLTVDRTGLRRWYALFEARWRRWHGVSRDDRWAILGGQMVARPGRRRSPFWVWNGAMKQLYLSAYHIAENSAADYLEAMKRHGVVYLLGYPSAMAELARCALERGLEGPELEVIISNAEPLSSDQRHLLSQFFGCPVRDTYGMAEMVVAAGECEHGTLHLWPEAGVVEVLDDEDRPVPPGETGRFVCTGLLNHAMPLIRYEVGDRGALAAPDHRCECGRALPIVQSIEGRLDDLVHTPDGRRIGRLDTIFKADLPIRSAQIVQEDMTRLTVSVVPEADYNSAAEKVIRSRLIERVGEMDIIVKTVESIPRGPGGKRRGVLSRVR